MWGYLFVAAVFMLLVLSVYQRVQFKTREKPNSKAASPLAQALASLVGTAGGIYISLTALASFLDLDVPEKIAFGGVKFEPLASIAVAMAICQPLALKWWRSWRQWR